MAQGCRRSRSFEKVSVTLNRRMKAIRFPSGDQRGAISRSVLGERKRRRFAPAAHFDDPNVLLGAGGIGRWVRIFSRRILALATHVGNRISIWREKQIAQFLPVIAVVMRQLPARPRRPFRNPNVALSFDIECPTDLVATL